MKKITVYLGIFLILVAPGLIYFQSDSGKSKIARYLEDYFHKHFAVRLEIPKLDYSLFPFTLVLTDAWLTGHQKQKHFLVAKRIVVELPYSNLWKETITIRKLEIHRPELDLSNLPTRQFSENWLRKLRIEEGRITDGYLNHSKIAARDLMVDASVHDNRLLVQRTTARIGDMQLTSSGVIEDLSTPRYRFQYRMNGNVASAMKIFGAALNVAGEAAGGGNLSGKESHYVLDGEIAGTSLSIDHSIPFAAKAIYRFDPKGPLPLKVKVQWESMHLKSFHRWFPRIRQFATITDGYYEYSGGLNAWLGRGRFETDLRPSKENGIPLAGNISGQLSEQKIRIDAASLQVRNSNILSTGIIDRSGLNLQLQASIPDTASLIYFSPELSRIPGSYRITGTMKGSYKNPQFSGELAGRVASIGDLRGTLSVNQERLIAKASFPQLSAKASAAYDLEKERYRLFAQFSQTELHRLQTVLPELLKQISGKITATLEASGKASQWKSSSASLIVQEGTLTKHGITATLQRNSRAKLQNGKVNIDLAATIPDGSITLAGAISLDRTFPMALQMNGNGNLKVISAFTDRYSAKGPFSLNLEIRGTPSNPLYRGEIRAPDFAFGFPEANLHLTKASAVVDVREKEFAATSEGQLNGSPMELRAILPFHDAAGDINLRVSSFPFSHSQTSTSGKLNVQLNARGNGRSLSGWSGTAEITPSEVKFSNSELTVSPIHAVLSSGVLRVEQISGRSKGMLDFTAGGTFDFVNGTMQAKIQAEANPGTAVYQNGRFTGTLLSDLTIQGKISSPEYYGNLSLDRASFQPADFPLPIEDIRLQASFQKDSLQLENFQAGLGGGQVTGDGTIQFDKWQIAQWNLQFKANQVALNYPNDIRSESDADLKITGGGASPMISGKLLIRRAIISRGVDNSFRAMRTALSNAAILKDARSSSPATSDAFKQIQLDLEIENEHPVIISNNSGNVLASFRLKMKGNHSNPDVSGEIDIEEGGQLYINARTFRVDRGKIRLNGAEKIKAIVDGDLSSVVYDDETKQSYTIHLPLRGPVDELENTIPESVPSLLPYQIYFLILTGRAETQVTRAEARFMRQQLMRFLTGKTVLPVSEKVATSAISSRVEIQPEVISAEQDPAGKLVNGKDFYGGMSLIYSLPLEKASEQTWIADYKFLKNIAFRFIDQQDGTISSTVRHSLRFGKGSTLQNSSPVGAVVPATNGTKKIGSVQIQNRSSLPDDQVRTIFDLKAGESYGSIDTRHKIADLKQALQMVGHLYPSIELKRQESDDTIDLVLVVSGNGIRVMKFLGVQPDTVQMEKYNEWWRQSFGEASVLALIQQDLLRNLRIEGHHLASIRQRRESRGDHVTYWFEATPGPAFPEGTLRFTGANHLKDAEEQLSVFYSSRKELIAEAIHDFAAFDQKLRAIYVMEGYWLAKVSHHENRFDEATHHAEVSISVEEGPQSRIARVLISDGHAFPEELKSRLRLREGSSFDSDALIEDELAIGHYYENHGHYRFKIKSEIQPGEGPDLNLIYTIHPGETAKVHSIRISGNHHSRKSLIEKHLGFQQGDVLKQSKLAEAQKNLNDLRLFEQVKISARQTSVPEQYAVIVQIEEQPNYEISYAAGYNSEKKWEAAVQLSDLNVLGTGHTLSALGKVNSDDQIYRLVYHAPDMFGIRWNPLISASFEKLQQPLLFTETAAIEFQKQQEFWGPFFFVGSYRFERVDIKPRNPAFMSGEPVRISRLAGTILSDTKNDPIEPTKGRLISMQLSIAPSWLGSDSAFVRSYSQFSNYRSFGKKVWASGIRLGIANPSEKDLIATERFFAGGSYSLRGFEKDSVGPKDPALGEAIGGEAVLIINQEFRFPIPVHQWVHGVVFYDAGNVYRKLSDFDPTELRHSLGIGLRLRTPFGIGRFDVGFNLRPKAQENRAVFHFGIGQAF